jgi:hypothetical protein
MSKSKVKKSLVIFLAFYLTSYVLLSRASLLVNNRHNLNMTFSRVDTSFYYIPVSEQFLSDHDNLFRAHIALRYFYYPVNWIDFYILSGPYCSNSTGMTLM